jgi:type 1 glutamine amidotransferase
MDRMRRPGSRRIERPLRQLLAGGALLAAGCHSSSEPKAPLGEECTARPASVVTVPVPAPAEHFRVLVFTRHLGFAHASIPVAIEAVHALGSATGFAVDATEDPSRFTDAGLAPYAVVVFLNTTGDVLDAGQQGAMERWVAAGHGWVGVHAAADTEYEWAWYQAMLGAHFVGHAAVQRATIAVADTANASTRRLASPLSRVDEWYDFASQPAAGTRILVRVDESTYSGGHMGAIHPLSWLQSYGGGRAWYTAMGHTSCSWTERPFLEHVRGGILWAAGMDGLAIQPL